MAKVTSPLFSAEASGKFAGSMVFSKWRGIATVRELVKPGNPKTAKQTAVREAIRLLTSTWRTSGDIGTGGAALTVDAGYKALWNTAASGKQYSGFNLYVKRYMEQMRDAGNYAKGNLNGVTPITTPS